jgi:hypothetical protein
MLRLQSKHGNYLRTKSNGVSFTMLKSSECYYMYIMESGQLE